jgi:hypothetical protein
MLLEHRTYREMAQRLDCSAATIAEDVKAVREEWHQRAGAHYGTWLAEESAKLDAIEATVLPKACAGDLRAVDRQLALMARRARLHGLDQPEAVAEWQSRQRSPASEPEREEMPKTLGELFRRGRGRRPRAGEGDPHAGQGIRQRAAGDGVTQLPSRSRDSLR